MLIFLNFNRGLSGLVSTSLKQAHVPTRIPGSLLHAPEKEAQDSTPDLQGKTMLKALEREEGGCGVELFYLKHFQ